MAGSYVNNDGLEVRFGTDIGNRGAKAGVTTGSGKRRELVLIVDLVALGAGGTSFTADLNNDGTKDGFNPSNTPLPVGAIIVDKATIINLTTPAGGTSYSVGTWQEVGTVVDADVYVANGAGSGAWTAIYSGIIALNQYFQTSRMDDISAVNNRVFFDTPVQSEIVSLSAILDGAVTTGDATLSIYVNGVLFTDTLVVPFASSTVGTRASMAAITANTVSAGSVIEVRSNGGCDTTQKAYITLGLRAQ